MHKVYYTSVDCNPLTPLLRFVLYLLYNLFLHCCAAVDKILTDTRTVADPVKFRKLLKSHYLSQAFNIC